MAICRNRNGSGGAAAASGGVTAVGAQELNMVTVAPHYTGGTCYLFLLQDQSVMPPQPNHGKQLIDPLNLSSPANFSLVITGLCLGANGIEMSTLYKLGRWEGGRSPGERGEMGRINKRGEM
uniref:Uncharacterized protein n=1 Tax=Arundo donax TaxID=35708 RepID=A0A0A9EMY6_ARUDO